MMFHVKRSSGRHEKKVAPAANKGLIQAIWVRVRDAFERIDPRITQAQMAKLIRKHGAGCSDRTLGKYASGESMPGTKMMIAISKATGASLDSLVFGQVDRSADLDLITQAFIRFMDSYGLAPDTIPTQRHRELLARLMKLPEQELAIIERMISNQWEVKRK